MSSSVLKNALHYLLYIAIIRYEIIHLNSVNNLFYVSWNYFQALFMLVYERFGHL